MILFTMAGDGTRFRKEGFTQNKYELMLQDKTLLQHSVLSFRNFFNSERFCFAYRSDLIEESWIIKQLNSVGLFTSIQLVDINSLTKGQAETAFLALQNANVADRERLIIFNIDSFYSEPIPTDAFGATNSTIDLVRRLGSHWSFAQLDDDLNVTEVAEKIRISEFCSTGLYHFESVSLFEQAYRSFDFCGVSEYFVMPIYQYLIDSNLNLRGRVVDDQQYIVAGTPLEYREACARYE